MKKHFGSLMVLLFCRLAIADPGPGEYSIRITISDPVYAESYSQIRIGTSVGGYGVRGPLTTVAVFVQGNRASLGWCYNMLLSTSAGFVKTGDGMEFPSNGARGDQAYEEFAALGADRDYHETIFTVQEGFSTTGVYIVYDPTWNPLTGTWSCTMQASLWYGSTKICQSDKMNFKSADPKYKPYFKWPAAVQLNANGYSADFLDSDGDGFTDEDEIEAGTDPFDGDDYPGHEKTDDGETDTDGDGVPDDEDDDPNDPNVGGGESEPSEPDFGALIGEFTDSLKAQFPDMPTYEGDAEPISMSIPMPEQLGQDDIKFSIGVPSDSVADSSLESAGDMIVDGLRNIFLFLVYAAAVAYILRVLRQY